MTIDRKQSRPERDGRRYQNYSCPLEPAMLDRLRRQAALETERVQMPVPVVAIMRRYIKAGLEQAERTKGEK